MTLAYKVLGQVNPTASTTSTLYTVPAATSCVVSTITVCNQGTTATTFRVAVRPAGVALPITAVSQYYINYETALPGNDTLLLTMGMTLATTDVVSVFSTSSFTSFSAFGSEVT